MNDQVDDAMLITLGFIYHTHEGVWSHQGFEMTVKWARLTEDGKYGFAVTWRRQFIPLLSKRQFECLLIGIGAMK